jgi:hypothetical protein
VNVERQRKLRSFKRFGASKDRRPAPAQQTHFLVDLSTSNWSVQEIDLQGVVAQWQIGKLARRKINGSFSFRFADSESKDTLGSVSCSLSMLKPDADDAGFMYVHGKTSASSRTRSIMRREQIKAKRLGTDYDVGHVCANDQYGCRLDLKTKVVATEVEWAVRRLEENLAVLTGERERLKRELPNSMVGVLSPGTELVAVSFDRESGSMTRCFSSPDQRLWEESHDQINEQTVRGSTSVRMNQGTRLPKKLLLLRQWFERADVISDRLLVTWRKLLFVWLQLPRLKGRVQLEQAHFDRLLSDAKAVLHESSAIIGTELPELHERLHVQPVHSPEIRRGPAGCSTKLGWGRRHRKKEQRLCKKKNFQCKDAAKRNLGAKGARRSHHQPWDPVSLVHR